MRSKNGIDLKGGETLIKLIDGKKVSARLHIGKMGEMRTITLRPEFAVDDIGNGCGSAIRLTSPDDLLEWTYDPDIIELSQKSLTKTKVVTGTRAAFLSLISERGFAGRSGIDKTVVSAWKSGKRVPTTDKMEEVLLANGAMIVIEKAWILRKEEK